MAKLTFTGNVELPECKKDLFDQIGRLLAEAGVRAAVLTTADPFFVCEAHWPILMRDHDPRGTLHTNLNQPKEQDVDDGNG